MLSLSSKVSYLIWAAAKVGAGDDSCPACTGKNTRLIRRKYLVTALYGCDDCHLMFRVPKGDPSGTTDFYQSDYKEGFTTDCPPPAELERMKQTRFAGTEKDYSSYIDVLKAAGLPQGASILDFGCSWGYGSWQLRQAGFKVYSYEISKPRGRYAETMLGCTMVTPESVPEKVDCIFSSHVIEHLERPQILWDVATFVLRPGGMTAIFMPNGHLKRERVHSIWGRVHPLLITADALKLMAERAGFAGNVYTSPYPLQEIAAGKRSDSLTGLELMILARTADVPVAR